jgi:pantoate--beta-alanine ligase
MAGSTPLRLETVMDVRAQTAQWQREALRWALVPTMGALHEGHVSLVRLAATHADRVIVSIFVNPRQFGPSEDFSLYPRPIEQDARLLAAAGCHALFLPQPEEIYPPGYQTRVVVPELAQGLCGAARPGHFEGVATVVTKLLNIAQPHVAIFGEKDFQQLLVIRRLARDLNVPAQIIGAPLMRDADGLALSSRNAYLSAAERGIALALPRSLAQARDAIVGGADVGGIIAGLQASLLAAGFDSVDYVALCDEETLQPVDTMSGPARLLAAGRVGKTRLIDNLAVSR